MELRKIKHLTQYQAEGAHKLEKYFVQILTGDVESCKKMKLAASRHFQDLERIEKDERFVYHFDYELADEVIELCSLFNIVEGSPIKLMEWQIAFVASLFGWVDDNGYRRFKESFCQVARKNGKSGLAGVIALIHLLLDEEVSKELYTIATKQDQAKIVLGDLAKYIQNDRNLAELFKIFFIRDEASKITCKLNNSKALALGKNAKSMDGLRGSFVIADEIHEHPDDKLVNVVKNSMRHRKQGHILKITTAGLSCVGYGYNQYEYYSRVLTGEVDDDRSLAFIFELDEGDDWQDESNYIKSNPSIPYLISLEGLMEDKKTAIYQRTYQLEFRTKLLNQWLNGAGEFITQDEWLEGQVPYDDEELKGQMCFGGLDLSSSRDLTSFALIFPQEDGSIKTKTWSFVPEDTARDKELAGSVDYESLGVILTPGNVIDKDYVMTVIRQSLIDYNVQYIAYDRWKAEDYEIFFHEIGADGEPFGQGYKSFTPPMQELEILTLKNKIHTNNDKVLSWCISNLVPDIDGAGNIKAEKHKALNKIDTAVALIMAIGAYLNYKKYY
ncbi:terminase large subunit [Carboxylicivirga sp. M1479]|uniref:terminase large subunit n=1 Tax=Carboxylicivirga sp. M1479 TaxID=2594476 RepID=UPI00117789CF|nr:terminase TerL endonuclease subunit [Carboxylicivirga sp. M1479]TRX71514.1 terminase large subunit [Carboxylicivirga sp. M1479]